MFNTVYELILNQLLGYTANTPELYDLPALALAITTVIMVIAVIGLFNIAVALLSLPFRWLS
jgi:hypothetical protein